MIKKLFLNEIRVNKLTIKLLNDPIRDGRQSGTTEMKSTLTLNCLANPMVYPLLFLQGSKLINYFKFNALCTLLPL